jgi:transposase
LSAELAPHPGGRPTKFTPETRDAICDALRAGASYELACRAAGLAYFTFRRWIERGEDAERAADDSPAAAPYREFCERVKRAEWEHAQRNLALLAEAARLPQHWPAAAWQLERRHPEYRQNVQHQHGGTVAHTLQLVDLASIRPRADLPPGAGTWNGHAIETTARETPATTVEGATPPPGGTGG